MSTTVKKVIEEYDNSTGEILKSTTYRSIKSDNIIPFKPRHSFAKVFINDLPKFSKMAHQGYFSILTRQIQKYTNVLVKKRKGAITPASAEELAEVIGVSVKSFRRFLTEAKRLGAILGLNTTKGYGYVLNPAYAYNGSGVDAMLFLMFEKDERFVRSLNKEQILEYNSLTGTNYYENVKVNFPAIYREWTSV